MTSQRVTPFSSVETGELDRLSSLPSELLNNILVRAAGDDLVCMDQVKSIFKLSQVSHSFANAVAKLWGWPIVVMHAGSADMVLYEMVECQKPDIAKFTEPIVVIDWDSDVRMLKSILYSVENALRSCKCSLLLHHSIELIKISKPLLLPDVSTLIVEFGGSCCIDYEIVNAQKLERFVIKHSTFVEIEGECNIARIEGGGADVSIKTICPKLEYVDACHVAMYKLPEALKKLQVDTFDSHWEFPTNLESITIRRTLFGDPCKIACIPDKLKRATLPCPCNIQEVQNKCCVSDGEAEEMARFVVELYRQFLAHAEVLFLTCGAPDCENACRAIRGGLS